MITSFCIHEMESHKIAITCPSAVCRGQLCDILSVISTSSYDSPLRGGCFSYDAALSRTSIHSAQIQLIPHVDTSANTDTVKGGTRPVERAQKWTRGLTRSPCHQVELKCCGSQAKATLNRRAARTRETHSPQPRSPPDIINYHFINFASGHRESHAVARMMC